MKMLKIEKFFQIRKCFQSTSTSIKKSEKLTNEEIRQHRLKIFEREYQYQLDKIRRIEKIEVNVEDPIGSKKLLMNKYLSTPLDCAKHISSILVERSCLALIDNKYYWDLNRPLENDCHLKFLHFLDENPQEQNRAYWRTSSFLIGYLLETSFKSDYHIELCSFPSTNFQSGSFVYDCKLNLDNIQLTSEDLRCLSIQASKLSQRNLHFQRLNITESVANEMFMYDQFKLKQIPLISRLFSSNDNQPRLTVYRMGNDHVDITQGPLISSTKQIGRFEFTSIHHIDVQDYNQTLQRVQAISIPTQLHLHYWTFDYLIKRAKKLNKAPFPSLNNKNISQNK